MWLGMPPDGHELCGGDPHYSQDEMPFTTAAHTSHLCTQLTVSSAHTSHLCTPLTPSSAHALHLCIYTSHRRICIPHPPSVLHCYAAPTHRAALLCRTLPPYCTAIPHLPTVLHCYTAHTHRAALLCRTHSPCSTALPHLQTMLHCHSAPLPSAALLPPFRNLKQGTHSKNLLN